MRIALAVCGANAAQQDSLIEEGIADLGTLVFLKPYEILQVISTTNRKKSEGTTSTPEAALSGYIGLPLSRVLQALVCWCRERRRSGQSLDPREITQEALMGAHERYEALSD